MVVPGSGIEINKHVPLFDFMHKKVFLEILQHEKFPVAEMLLTAFTFTLGYCVKRFAKLCSRLKAVDPILLTEHDWRHHSAMLRARSDLHNQDQTIVQHVGSGGSR